MITWTTPTLMMTIKGVQLDNVSFAVTLTQGNVSYTFDNPDVQICGCNTVLAIDLTQLESSQFVPGMAKLQVNWTDGFGHRCATTIKSVSFGENLLKEVI